MSIEKVIEKGYFHGVGWARLVADRPYHNTLDDDSRVELRIELIPLSEIAPNAGL